MDETKQRGPIFVVGCPRSGTTLLQYMLRAHPRISLPTSESHFFIPLYRNKSAYGNLSSVESMGNLLTEMYKWQGGFFDEEMHGIKFDVEALANEFHRRGVNTVEGVIAAVFEKNALGEGKARWGDKTPYYALHLPTILEMFPDAQVIHLIRDGRGVAWSLMDRKYDFKVYSAYIAAKYWQQYVEAARSAGSRLGKRIYLEIKYEDLLEEPEEQLRKVCEFLGEEYSPALLEYEKPSETTHTLLHKPVQKSNVNKWRRLMTRSQIRIFEGGAGHTLTSFGYELVTSGKTLPKPIRALFRFHNLLASWWYRHRKSWKSE